MSSQRKYLQTSKVKKKFFHAAEFCLEIKPSEPKQNYEVSCLFDARNEIRHRKQKGLKGNLINPL